MRAMRIGKIAGAIHLLWFELTEKLHGLQDIGLAHGFFLDGTRFVERQVHEMDVLILESYIPAGSAGFAATDQALDGTDLGGIDIAGFFGLEITGGLFQDLGGFLDRKSVV